MFFNQEMGESLLVNDLPKVIKDMCRSLAKIEGLLTEQAKNVNHHNPNELLTTEQAAEFLHLAVPTLYSKVCKGEISTIKRGKRLRFYKRDLTKYLDAGYRKSHDEIKEDAINRLGKRKGVSHAR